MPSSLESSRQNRFTRREWLVCVILFLVTFILFSPVRHHEFINYDDQVYITQNPHITAGLTWDGVRWAFLERHFEMWHPLTSLSHMLDVEWFGLSSAAHHLMNVLIHSLSAALLFATLRLMTGVFWPAFVVAALFAWHPLRVESVAWASERKDVMCALFWLLTLLAYTCYARRRSWKSYLVLLAVFAMATLTKPMIVTLPVTLLLLDLWPLNRIAIPGRSRAQDTSSQLTPAQSSHLDGGRLGGLRFLLLEKIPLMTLSFIAGLMTLNAHKSADFLVEGDRLALLSRLANAPVALCRYLGKMVWPAELPVFYPHPGHWPMGVIAASSVAVLAITALVIWRVRRQPFLAVGWFWFLIVLAPVIGVVQAGEQSLANRYTYISTVGLIIMVVWQIAEWVKKRERNGLEKTQSLDRSWDSHSSPDPMALAGGRELEAKDRTKEDITSPRATALSHDLFGNPLRMGVTLSVAAALLACLAATRWQLAFWKDSETLFRRAVAITEGNDVALNNLGTAVGNKGRMDEAEKYLRMSYQINPYNPALLSNLSMIVKQRGNVSEMASFFTEAAQTNNEDEELWFQSGLAHAKLQNWQNAATGFSEAARINPSRAQAHANLAYVLNQVGDPRGAVQAGLQALAANPDHWQAHLHAAFALEKLGEFKVAGSHYQRALKLNPSNSIAQAGVERLSAEGKAPAPDTPDR